MQPYDTDINYIVGTEIHFADFSVLPKPSSTREMLVAGAPKLQIIEPFSVKLRNGNKIEREFTSGYPGVAHNEVRFAVNRNLYFAIIKKDKTIRAQRVNELYQFHAEKPQLLRIAATQQWTNITRNEIVNFPSFAVRIDDIKSQRTMQQLTPAQIDAWYVNAKKSVATANSVDHQQIALNALEQARKNLEKNPHVETMQNSFNLALFDETPNTHNITVSGDQPGTASGTLGTTKYVLEFRPDQLGRQNTHLEIRDISNQ